VPPFPQLRAHAFAQRLDLDLETGICLACLSFVSCALDGGDPAEVARQLRRVTRDLWAEGLEDQAVAAVGRACENGVAEADAALADLERNGDSSWVARSIVLRLAEELSRRARRLDALTHDRLRPASPELN
jgi:hypothetical protein